MAKSTVIKLYKHFCKLAKGDFTERDYDKEFNSEAPENDAGGWISMGKMTPDRRALIMSDAKANKEALENKTKLVIDPTNPKRLMKVKAFPFLTEKEEKKEENDEGEKKEVVKKAKK